MTMDAPRARARLPAALTAAAAVVLLARPAITDFYSYNAAYYNGLVASAAISAILTISLNLSMGYGGLLSMMHTGMQLLGGYAVAYTTVKAPAVVRRGGGGDAARRGLLRSGAGHQPARHVPVLRHDHARRRPDRGRGRQRLGRGHRRNQRHRRGDPGGLSKNQFYYVVLAALALVYAAQRNLVRSGVGRAVMAVRESPDTAAALGIRPTRTKAVAFTFSGAIAGLSGGLYALQLGFINPEVGILDNGLVFFVGLFLGGIGTLATR